MDESLPWTISFYEDDDGSCPVAEILLELPPKARMHVIALMERLRMHNINARAPLAEHLDGKLWELRAECCTNIYRFIYCTSSDRHIIFFHGFQKKTRKTPHCEINIALIRYKKYLARL